MILCIHEFCFGFCAHETYLAISGLFLKKTQNMIVPE